MNIFFITLIIFVIVYVLLTWFARTSAKKISRFIRILIIFSAIILAILMAYAGRYIFSLPFVLAILPLIKTKAGISLFQLFRLWGLFRVLRSSGRFNFNNFNQSVNKESISLDEAYSLLGLKKGASKEEVIQAAQKLQKKIHPDMNRDVNTERLSQLVNEAKEKIIKSDFS